MTEKSYQWKLYVFLRIPIIVFYSVGFRRVSCSEWHLQPISMINPLLSGRWVGVNVLLIDDIPLLRFQRLMAANWFPCSFAQSKSVELMWFYHYLIQSQSSIFVSVRRQKPVTACLKNKKVINVRLYANTNNSNCLLEKWAAAVYCLHRVDVY